MRRNLMLDQEEKHFVTGQTMAAAPSDDETQLDPDQSIGATARVVIDTLFARIKSEEYPVDTRLPSERTLASELGVARNTVREALDVLEAATGPRTTRQSSLRWSDNPDWKLDYSNVEMIAPEELERRREEFQRQKEIAHAKRAQDLKGAEAAE